jgi:hypothetical protein
MKLAGLALSIRPVFVLAFSLAELSPRLPVGVGS